MNIKKVVYLCLIIYINLYCDFLVQDPVNPCATAVCGPNSQCREINGQPICSCVPTFVGTPPACRPECVVSAECPQNEACVKQKCVNPCIGACGLRATCQVINHNPVCACAPRHSGDPFVACEPVIGNYGN